MVQDGISSAVAFSGATDCDGIRKTMKYELSAQAFRAPDQRRQGQFAVDRDPAGTVRQTVGFTPQASLLLSGKRYPG